MQTYIPFSEKQQIFTPAEWEEMRLLDTTCETSKVSAEIMRKVVQRLLRIDKTGKDFNINDFEFVVSDDDQANAAFVSKSKTQNGKCVIFITKGILDLCANEDEFAGVLAHELGHFTYDKIYGDNKNTVFQERFSDLHALDFMIAGGYDPAAYSKVCEKMYNSSFGSIAVLDVHGSSFARKEDVDTYLTKLHKEQGNFVVSPQTGLWNNFVQTLKKSQDEYKSYFSQVLEHNFPKLSKYTTYLLPIKSVLDIILSEIQNGRLNSRVRMKDMLGYIHNSKASLKKEIHSTQKFLEQLINIYNQNFDVNKNLYHFEINTLTEDLQTKFRGNKPFNIFEPISKDVDKINEFMTTRDIERVKELALDLRDDKNRIFDIRSIKQYFSKPTGFKLPPHKTAKGVVMPTDWLMSIPNLNVAERSAILDVIEKIGLDHDYDYMTDHELKSGGFYARYVGKIIATGTHECEKIKENHKRQQNYKRNHQCFNDFMDALNILYEFNKEKIPVKDVWEYFAKHTPQPGIRRGQYELRSILYHLKQRIELQDYNQENSFLESDLQALNNNEAFAELYIKPFLKILKQALQTTSPQLAQKIHLDNPPINETWFEYVSSLYSKYFKVKEYRTKVQLTDNIILEGDTDHIQGKLALGLRKLGVQHGEESVYNVPNGPFVQYLLQLHSDTLHSIIKKLYDTSINEGICSASSSIADLFYDEFLLFDGISKGSFDGNEIIDKIHSLEREKHSLIKHDIIENYSVYANRNQWILYDRDAILKALDAELQENTDMHKIQRLLTAFGMVANTEQELINILSNPIQKNFQTDTLHLLETKLKEYAFIYYMHNNLPITNLYNLLYGLLNDKISKFSAKFKDTLSDYIDTHNLMPTDFQNTYDLYAIMQKLKFFSEEKSNQSKFWPSLISQVEKMPASDKEEYSWRLLSGFFYSDDDVHCLFNRESDELDNPIIKNRLLEMYANTLAARFGGDDNSDEYYEKIQTLLQHINQKHIKSKLTNNYYTTRYGISKTTRSQLYRLLSDKIQSQERVSQLFADDARIVISNNDIQEKNALGLGFETVIDILKRKPQVATYFIEFLNRKLTTKSMEYLCEQCANYIGKNDEYKTSTESLENFYNTFWTSGLEIRSVIMNKLLNRACKTLDEKIAYVCNMNFSKDNKYRKDAELIFDCVIKSFEEYEQGLILAAVASADENKTEGETSSRSVGDGLRMFCENMGPAWVKFGQLLSYVPELPSEIRRDLGKLKDKADIPARWTLYNQLQEALPEDLRNRIERVEDIPGAGSFWVTAVIQFRTDKGKTEKKVIQLLRPKAAERAEAGFETIEKAIKALTKHNSSYSVLKNVAHQARESAKYEVDAEFGNKQYIKAKELYGDIKVQVEGTTYTPHVADWDYYGTGKDGVGYKIMDYAKGATLSRVQASEDERRKMALAYFTIELTNLFKGDVWDIDRHQGQQNFDVLSDKEVQINIYDTGAQLPKAPNKTNKIILANVFFGLIASVESGKSIDSYILKVIHHLDKLQKTLNVDVSYVSNVQKGLMALSDILEYQKELKDADGHIIQESKKLSRDDLSNAAKSVLANPSVDTYLKVIIEARFLTHKLSKWELDVLKSFGHEKALDEDNPVLIEIAQQAGKIDSKRQNKTQGEIDALYNPEDYTLGIPNKHIAKNADETVANQLKQLGLSLG